MSCDLCGFATEFNSKYCDSCASLLSISEMVTKYEDPDLVYSAKCSSCKGDMVGENCTLSVDRCNECVVASGPASGFATSATSDECKEFPVASGLASGLASGPASDEYSRYSELCEIASEEAFAKWWIKYKDTVVSIPVSAERMTECPACGMGLFLEQVNCAVFRCAYVNGESVNPHATLANLVAIKNSNKSGFVGCMMPLVFDQAKGELFVPLDECAENVPHFY